LTRLAQKKPIKTSKDIELFQIKEIYEYTRGLRVDKISRLEEYF
jgi:hypothetical protein